MCSDPGGLSLLDRRRIEALVLGPMIRALQRELGGERAAAIARRVIEEIAKEQGGALRARVRRGDLKAFAESRTASRADGALEVTVLACRRDRYEFDVTRCRYAEMYREMGYADLGLLLSCGRDAPFAEGFNPAVRLTRTTTIMEGAPTCDFRYHIR